MDAFWISANELDNRIDSEFYRPEFIKAYDRLRENVNVTAFSELWTDYNRIYIGIAGFEMIDNKDGYTPYLRPSDIGSDGEIDYTNLPWCKKEWLVEHGRNGCAHPGDLIVEVKGNTKKAAVISNRIPDNCIVSGSSYRIRLRDDFDSQFVRTYLLSESGQLLKRRLTSNTTISYIDPESFKSYLIPTPELRIQNAIGNYVRKADRLREIADKEFKHAIKILESELQWNKIKNLSTKNFTWVFPDELEQRLDSNYNSPQRFNILNHYKNQHYEFQSIEHSFDISAMIGWKGLTTEYYTDKGPYLIRGVDFEDGLLVEENLVHVDYEKYEEQPQIHLMPNDIIMIKDGSNYGKCFLIPNLSSDMCAGSTVARLRNKTEISSYYFLSILNHDVIQNQIKSMSTGMAQPHITQEWISELFIPIIPSFCKVSKKTKTHYKLKYEAKMLMKEAKRAIEDLINGDLIKEELLVKGIDISSWLEQNPSLNS